MYEIEDLITKTLEDMFPAAPGATHTYTKNLQRTKKILSVLRKNGFEVVPREATEAMMLAVDDLYEKNIKTGDRNPLLQEIWKAMIEASNE